MERREGQYNSRLLQQSESLMQPYVSFIISHWFLCAIFLASFIWVMVVEAQSRLGKAASVTPREAVTMINKEKAKVLDIRAKDAFSAGHIVGSKSVAADAVVADKAQKTIIVCYKGITAAALVNRLRKAGNPNVFSLEGGMQAWVRDELPLTKGN